MPNRIFLPHFVARRELAGGLADLDKAGDASLIAMLIEENLAKREQLDRMAGKAEERAGELGSGRGNG